ncbi:MAG TPA: hypothetical protein PKK39_07290 [Tepidiformaceae bacterium]|nr:hypothetical protein [Tepidiformaceae bacterium]
MRLFDRKAGAEATVFAEAQALLDDGMAFDDVLDLFSAEASWLEPLLRTTTGMRQTVAAEQPSYYFEASLKSQFLNAARNPKPAQPVVMPAPVYSPVRTAAASLSVAGMAAAVGVLALGFITAGNAVPGDWNYTFKLANERLEYTLSRGDGRVDVQLHQVENRVVELQKLSSRGDVSPEQLERAQRDLADLQQIAGQRDLDQIQRARLEGIGRQGKAVVVAISEKQPDIPQETVDATAAGFDAVATLGASGPTEIPTATATATASPTASPTTPPTASPSASPSATAEPSATASPSATTTATPEPTASASPTGSATAEPTSTGTATPGETETSTPPATHTP